MTKNLNTFVFFILLCSFSFYIIYFSFNFGQDGHDTFQYIEYANQVFSDKPFILFYRVGIYSLIFAFNSIFGWEPYSLSILYSFFAIITLIYLYLLARNFLKSESLIFFAYFFLFFNTGYLIFFQRNYTSIIEIACILGFIYHFYLLSGNQINFKKKNINVNIFLTGFFAFFATHVHEDKSIFFLTFIFLYFFINKLISIKVFLVFFLLSLITAYYFGLIEVFISLFKVNSIISDDFGSKADILQNAFFILKDTLNFFLGSFFLEVFLLLLIIEFFLKKKIKLDFVNIYLISLFFYILFLALFYGKINLTRVYAPVGIFVIIVFLYLIEKIYKELGIFSRVLIIIFFCFIFFNKINYFSNNIKTVENSKFYSVYNYIKSQNIDKDKYTIKILQLPSFEHRWGMWGNFNTYGLSSKVYFGENTENLNSYLNKNFHNSNHILTIDQINKIYEEFDYLIFDEKKNRNKSLNEQILIENIKKKFQNIYVKNNLFIVRTEKKMVFDN